MAVFGAEVFAGLTVGTLYTGALSHGQHGFWTVTAVGKSEVTLRKVNKGTDGITGGRMVTLSESEYDGLCKTWNEKRNGKVTLGMHHIIISKDKETAKEQRRMVAAAKRIAAKENIG